MAGKHILHIRDSSGIYGGERVILTLAKNMVQTGRFDVSLLCMRRAGGKSEELISLANKAGISVYPINVKGRLDLGAIRRIRRLIKEKNVSLIHTHDFKSNFYGRIATVKLNVKKVLTAHGSTRDSILKRLYLYFDEHVVYSTYDKIIAVSQDLRNQLTDKMIPSERVAVIQNGLDIDLLSLNNGFDVHPLPFIKRPGMIVFGVIGRLFPDKGQSLFLRAFADIASDYPECYALIVGDGPDRIKLFETIRTLKLGDRAYVCGVRKDIKLIYETIDFLVIPSLTEGLPYVLLEAMAGEVPVLATAVGDIPLLIKDRETGFLVSPGDVTAMACRMKELILKKKLVQVVAKAGKRLVQEKFSAEKMVEKTEELYFSLLS